MRKSNYRSYVTNDVVNGRSVICVEDLGGPFMSVTNNAESVVRDVVQNYGDHPVVYKDSEGRWDQLNHRSGTFTDFGFIGVTDRDEAVGKAK